MVEKDAYKTLAEAHGYGESQRYRKLLEFLMTPGQAALVAELPKTPEELSAALGLNVDDVKQDLDRLFRKGVVFPRNYETLDGARFARHAMQLHDSTMASLRLNPERHRRVFEMWDDFNRNESRPRRAANWPRKAPSGTRIVPAYQAVKEYPGLLPHENAEELLKAARSIAVVSCTCRKLTQAVGRKCKRSHDANCLQLDRGADYALARGTGTKVSLEEALDILKETEEDSLIHTWINNASMRYTVMCNCCEDCCEALAPLFEYDLNPKSKSYTKSRFEARVDQALCTGCQVCVDRCPFGAIEMVKVESQKKLKAQVSPEICMGCGVCVLGCGKVKALTMKMVRPPEHIPAAPI